MILQLYKKHFQKAYEERRVILYGYSNIRSESVFINLQCNTSVQTVKSCGVCSLTTHKACNRFQVSFKVTLCKSVGPLSSPFQNKRQHSTTGSQVLCEAVLLYKRPCEILALSASFNGTLVGNILGMLKISINVRLKRHP